MIKQRDSNIELLRIISMFMIVAYHLISNGLLKLNGTATYDIWMEGSIINRVVAALLYPGGAVGNMLFFMITGYFLAGSNKVRSFKNIVIMTIFYSSLLCLIFCIIKYELKITLYNYGGGYNMLSSLLLPVTGGRNWFATAYILLLLIIPILNPFLDSLSKTKFVIILVLFDIYITGLGYFLAVPFYDLYIALFYYGCGVFVKKFVNTENKKQKTIIRLMKAIFLWVFTACISYLYFLFSFKGRRLYSMAAIGIIRTVSAPLCAYSLFLFTLKMKLGEHKLINKIAGTTFAVYLIHGSVFQLNIWDSVFKINTVQYGSVYFPLYCLLDTVVIFFICSGIELIRKPLFERIEFLIKRKFSSGEKR